MAKFSYEELKLAAAKPADIPAFDFISHDELLALKIPPPKSMLGSWLPARGLAMVYAKTGVGKTQFCLTVAASVGAGRGCFGWDCPEAKRVLYLDGEMPIDQLQNNYQRLCNGMELEKTGLPVWFCSIDRQPKGVPKVDHMADQAALEAFIEAREIELIIVDNVSTLTSSEFGENEASSWEEMQRWALSQRSKGRAVLFVHHAGKSGAQRGTSKREDVLDSVVKLSRLDGGEEGFSIEFDKHRRGQKPDVIDVVFHEDDEQLTLIWSRQQSVEAQVIEMYNNGMPASEVIGEVSVSRPTVYRILKEANERGELTRPYKART